MICDADVQRINEDFAAETNRGRVIRIVLVESRQLLREALAALLGREQGVRVVAVANDASGCYECVEEFDPDIVLIDADMPGCDGITATRELLRRSPLRRVIVVSSSADERIAAQALAAGARGYLAHDDSSEELLQSVQQVVLGERHVSRQLRVDSVDALVGGGAPEPIGRLSRRERVVFEMLVHGQDNGMIATELRISIRTVETHRAAIMRKLELHSLAEMVRFAAIQGVWLGRRPAERERQ
jgi:two-component system NarL family response regulator